MKYNESFRIYDVIIVNKDNLVRRIEGRTKDEARSALKHYISSWTTKSMVVINTRTRQHKVYKP